MNLEQLKCLNQQYAKLETVIQSMAPIVQEQMEQLTDKESEQEIELD